MSFSGKVVLVTGASSGIGAATAVMFCKEGASVVLVARNEAKLKSVSEQCAAAGGKHALIKADVSSDGDVKRIINSTIEKFSKLDILVNNAGIIAYGDILSGTILDTYDQISKTNLRAVIHVTMLAAPHLVNSKGNIINISSVASRMIVNKFSAYSTSKAGLDQFTRCAAAELASSGVRVNSISPGPVDTDIFFNAGALPEFVARGIETPLGRVSQSDEIADLILYLASDKAKGITGSNFVSDNGVLLQVFDNKK
ncbi:unnamed protein product [Chilo suppressalis]|uniref:Ketoreductase domain-containing protein n=1 Tax=Chilo suppressalis TaxID=168631 RepID=A0ABN8B4T1_CHISP|nr:unnamed protein product [Chilo suppressalis]